MILQADAGYAADGSPHTAVSILDVEVDCLILSGISDRCKTLRIKRHLKNQETYTPKPRINARRRYLNRVNTSSSCSETRTEAIWLCFGHNAPLVLRTVGLEGVPTLPRILCLETSARRMQRDLVVSHPIDALNYVDFSVQGPFVLDSIRPKRWPYLRTRILGGMTGNSKQKAYRTAIGNMQGIKNNERSNPITVQRGQPNLLDIRTLQQLK